MTAEDEKAQWRVIETLRQEVSTLTTNVALLTEQVNRLLAAEQRRGDQMSKLIVTIIGSAAALVITGVSTLVVMWVNGAL